MENEYELPVKLFQNEILKPIEGYEDYLISNMGRVWSLEKEWWLIAHVTSLGYPIVTLINEEGSKSRLVHRLVAQAFIPNPDNLPIVNHKDENKHNAHYENLEWCTHEYNVNYGTAIARAIETRKKNKIIATIEEKNKKAVEDFLVEGKKWVGVKLFTEDYSRLVEQWGNRFSKTKNRNAGITTILNQLEESGYFTIKRGKTINKKTGKMARYTTINPVKKGKRDILL